MPSSTQTPTNIVNPNLPETSPDLNDVTSELTPVTYATGGYGFVDGETAEAVVVQSNLHGVAIEALIHTVNALVAVTLARRIAEDA